MIFYRAAAEDGSIKWAGTQADARLINKQFEQVDVPVDKAGLLDFVSAMQDRINDVAPRYDDEVDIGVVEAMVAAPEPVVERVVQEVPADLPGAIGALEGQPLIRVLGAAISRLGEVAGTRGWAAFAKDVYAWSPSSRSTEQGLGMLMLASFGAPTPPAPPSGVSSIAAEVAEDLDQVAAP